MLYSEKEDNEPQLESPNEIDMDYIYIFTGLLTVAFAIAGLVLTCYLERRWLTSLKSSPGKAPATELSADGLSS